METTKKGGKGIVLGLMALLFLAASAQAQLIIIAIEATVDYVNDEGNYLEGKVNVGDIITGYYIYDSATPDSNPDDNVGRYEHSQGPCGIFLTVGGINFQTDLSNVDFSIGVSNNYYSKDGYWIGSDNNISTCGTHPDHITWQIKDSTATTLQDDSLPTTAPILSQWDYSNDLIIEIMRQYRIGSTVTSAVLIPEPATIILLGLGGLLLKKRKQ